LLYLRFAATPSGPQENPLAPVWLPIITGLIAAGSALSGVILNNILARRDRILQHSLSTARENKDFLISRGEDLYVQLDLLDEYVSTHCRLIQALCSSRIEIEEFRRIRNASLDDRDKFSVAKIKLNVRSFFPALAADYEDIAENLSRINTIDRALMDAGKPDATLLVKANADSIRLQKLIATNGEQLRVKLSASLSEIFASRAQIPV
jgi:hypothetical protein